MDRTFFTFFTSADLPFYKMINNFTPEGRIWLSDPSSGLF